MSTAELNPYQSGNFDPVKADEGPAKRPTGLLVLAIIVIVFASMGLLANLGTIATYIANGGAANYEGQFGKSSPFDWHPAVLAKLNLLAPTHSLRNIVALVASLIVDMFVFVTAIAAVTGKKWGRTGFTIGCALSIALAIGQAAIAHVTSGEVNQIVSEHQEETGEGIIVAKNAKDEEMAEFTSKAMEFGFMIVPFFMWAWCGIKAIFYGSTILYLRKNNVRAYFQRAAVT
jgi:hypothetical protein